MTKDNQEICECGHTKEQHRLKIFRNGTNQTQSMNTKKGIGCLVSNCSCKKFTPKNQSQDSFTPDDEIIEGLLANRSETYETLEIRELIKKAIHLASEAQKKEFASLQEKIEEIDKEIDEAKSVLTNSHIQNNKYRLGVLGCEDLNNAIEKVKRCKSLMFSLKELSKIFKEIVK